MARELHLTALGLYTDPNPHAVPNGALRQAHNCVIRRPGVLEPRPGFKDPISQWTPPSNHNVRHIIPSHDDYILLSVTGSTWASRWGDSGNTITGFSGEGYGGHVGHASMRGNTYICNPAHLTDKEGIPLKVESAATTTFGEMGIERCRMGIISLVGTYGGLWTTSGQMWFRAVYIREDGNGYIRRSAPSGIHRTATSASKTPRATIVLPGDAAVGDVVEVYRTTQSSSATDLPSPVFRLTGQATVTTNDITNGYVLVNCDTEDAALGAELYTNSGQEGPLAENRQPPNCEDMAEFRRSMFFGACQTREAFELVSLRNQSIAAGGVPAIGSGQAGDWIDYGFITGIDCNVSTGVATISVNSHPWQAADSRTLEDCIKVGQLVTEDGQVMGSNGAYIAWPSYVTAVNDGAGTFNISPAPIGTNASVELATHDTVEIDGQVYAWAEDANFQTDPILADYNQSAGGTAYNGVQASFLLQNLCYAINSADPNGWMASVVSASEKQETLLVERHGYFEGGNTMVVTQGARWSPDGGASDDRDVQGTFTSEAESFPGRLYWSKSDLPEAVPPINYVDVGDLGQRILRIIPTRDGLWVLKEDGVWRLTGFSADSGWRVDPFSKDKLIAPRAADVMDDVAFAWFDGGVTGITAGGVQEIDAPIRVDLDDSAQDVRENGPAAGCFIVCNPVEDEVMVGAPGSGGGALVYADTLYVYNVPTKAWTTWGVGAGLTAIAAGHDNKLRLAKYYSTDYGFRVERRNETIHCADEEYSVTIAVGATYNWQDTAGNGWTTELGDAVLYSRTVGESGPFDVYAFVTQANGASEFSLTTPGSAENTAHLESTGTGTAYKVFESRVEWVCKSAGDPSMLKRWTDGALIWEAMGPLETNSPLGPHYLRMRSYNLDFKSDNRALGPTTKSTVAGNTQAPVVDEVVNEEGYNDSNTKMGDGYISHGTIIYPVSSMPGPVQFWVPRNDCLSAILRPRIAISQATVCWALAGLSLGVQPVSHRHRRQYGD